MSSNTDSVANQGEFKPRVPRDEPMMTGGHQPGKLVGNDNVPEFQAETLPAGSAPADRTFKPNNASDVPAGGDTADPDLEQASASDTIGGATSGDVHTGLGHPGSGQTSKELRHDGMQGNKNPGKSLEGVGAATTEFKTVDPHDPKFAHHRALDKDEAEVGRGNVGGAPAQEREPETASGVAAEHGGKSRQDRGT